MTLGRLSIHSAYDVNGVFRWAGEGLMRPPCGCIIAELGFVIIEWHSKKCMCAACGKHVCECPEGKT